MDHDTDVLLLDEEDTVGVKRNVVEVVGVGGGVILGVTVALTVVVVERVGVLVIADVKDCEGVTCETVDELVRVGLGVCEMENGLMVCEVDCVAVAVSLIDRVMDLDKDIDANESDCSFVVVGVGGLVIK